MEKSEKKQWIAPEVTDFDIAERTQVDPGSGPDVSTLGIDPGGGGGGGGGGGDS